MQIWEIALRWYVYSHRKCTLSVSLPAILICFHIAKCNFYVHGHCNHGYNRHYTCAYYDKSIISRVWETSLIVKAALYSCLRHSCSTCLDNSWYFSVHINCNTSARTRAMNISVTDNNLHYTTQDLVHVPSTEWLTWEKRTLSTARLTKCNTPCLQWTKWNISKQCFIQRVSCPGISHPTGKAVLRTCIPFLLHVEIS